MHHRSAPLCLVPSSRLEDERPASQQHESAQRQEAMQLSRAATLLACTAAVQAFSDSSPFILFSTAKFVSSPLYRSATARDDGLVADTVPPPGSRPPPTMHS